MAPVVAARPAVRSPAGQRRCGGGLPSGVVPVRVTAEMVAAGRVVGEPRLSPDGSTVAFVASSRGQPGRPHDPAGGDHLGGDPDRHDARG